MAEQTPTRAIIEYVGSIGSLSPSLKKEVLILVNIRNLDSHAEPYTASHTVRFLALPFADHTTAAAFFRNLAQEIEKHD